MHDLTTAATGMKKTPLKYYMLGIETGKSPAAENAPAGADEWGVLKVSAVQPGKFEHRENKVIRNAENINPQYEVRPGDLLMTRANTENLVGLACLAHTPRPQLMLSDKTLRLQINRERAEPEFILLALLHPATRKQIKGMATGTSAGMKNISQRQICNLQIPHLPLTEQRRIVAAHNAFEQRINALERVVEKRGALLSALINEHFRRSDSQLAPLHRLLTKVETGWSPLCESKKPAHDEWGVLRLSAITSGRFIETESKTLPLHTAPRPAWEIKPGDVLMSRANGVKRLVGVACTVGAVRSRLLLPDLAFRLISDPAALDPKFLTIALSSPGVRSQIDTVMRGTSGQYKISQSDIRSLRIPHLTLPQQQQIVAMYNVFKGQVDVLLQQITKVRLLQRALMEDALGGRVHFSAAA